STSQRPGVAATTDIHAERPFTVTLGRDSRNAPIDSNDADSECSERYVAYGTGAYRSPSASCQEIATRCRSSMPERFRVRRPLTNPATVACAPMPTATVVRSAAVRAGDRLRLRIE